jgi:uncharacterized protein YukE
MPSDKDAPPSLKIDVSPGELLDKITILEIKSEHIADAEKLANIRHELGLYRDTVEGQLGTTDALTALTQELKAVNEALWDIEDEIRACEAHQDFGSRFIELARSVYRTNDRRATIKRQINILCGSSIIEEKSYTQY